MKKVVSFLAVCALLGAGASAARAQFMGKPSEERTGTRDFENLFNSEQLIGSPEKASQAYAVGTSIARCVVNISGERSGELLGGPNTDDAGYRDLSRALQRRYSACLRDGGAVPPMIVNYGIAETLVLRSDAPLEDRATRVNVDEAATFQGNAQGPATMDSIARCLTVYSPGLAHKVVQSDAASPEEGAALQALYSQTPECGLAAPPATIPSVFQRGSLAVALYQWTHRAG